MTNRMTATILALMLSGTAVVAQTPQPPGSTAPPTAQAAPPPSGGAGGAATGAAPVAMDPQAEAKFKTADKDGNGTLDGAELAPFRGQLAGLDKDRDGKISREEFAEGLKAGLIR
jgi:hypothetical protein